jgi:DNA repair photolyase
MRYIANPPNPWSSFDVEWIGEPPSARLEVFEETATREIITHNDSPDVGFDFSVNCYRGCSHACTYCFSRPTHEYLGFGAGTDFETKIVAKVNAPKLLREAFMKRSWKGAPLSFSLTSDPYLPLEGHYKLTRQCLEICLEFLNPVRIITKSALVRRDIDLLTEISQKADLAVSLTIPFADRETAHAVEPLAPIPEARFKAMRELADAGIRVAIGIAPVIPGLNDSDIPQLLKRAHEAGARGAFMTMLRLPGSVAPYFEERLRAALPLRADRIMRRIREARGGKLNESQFGARMRGKGQFWEMIDEVFRLHCRRLGLNHSMEAKEASAARNTFRRPSNQTRLFD